MTPLARQLAPLDARTTLLRTHPALRAHAVLARALRSTTAANDDGRGAR